MSNLINISCLSVSNDFECFITLLLYPHTYQVHIAVIYIDVSIHFMENKKEHLSPTHNNHNMILVS